MDSYLTWLTKHLGLLNKYKSLPQPSTTDIHAGANDQLLALVDARNEIRQHLEVFFQLPPSDAAAGATPAPQVRH